MTNVGPTWPRTEVLHDASGTIELRTFLDDTASVTIEPGDSWQSEIQNLGFTARELIASWNAITPGDTWLSISARVAGPHRGGSESHDTADFTPWFTLGEWCSDAATRRRLAPVRPATVKDQRNEFGVVDTETFVASTKLFTRYQIRVTAREGAALGSHEASAAPHATVTSPAMKSRHAIQLNLVTAFASSPRTAVKPVPTSAFGGTAINLEVPQLAQLTHRDEYLDIGGGSAWCSPTCTTMIAEYWGHCVSEDELTDISASSDPQVPFAALNTYDHSYQGCGNWTFNTAYAHRFGLSGYVYRLRNLRDAERFIRSGVPLVASVRISASDLPEAGYETPGHLLVIRGFTAEGDVIVNDSSSTSNAAVQRVYGRAGFERSWARGQYTAYVIHPPHHEIGAIA